MYCEFKSQSGQLGVVPIVEMLLSHHMLDKIMKKFGITVYRCTKSVCKVW